MIITIIKLLFLSQVEDYSSDEISRDSLEYSHNDFNSLNNHLNANLVEYQYFVQQIVGNNCCVKDQLCIEEKHEPLASSFEISQNAPHYDEEIGVS